MAAKLLLSSDNGYQYRNVIRNRLIACKIGRYQYCRLPLSKVLIDRHTDTIQFPVTADAFQTISADA